MNGRNDRFPAVLPEPTNTPLRGGPKLRWGILGPGGIGHDFTTALHRFTDQRAVATGSRSLERARTFAHRHGIERAYGSYEQLVGDPEVDVVYVSSPHSEHREHALLAIAAGKHVLIEKPMAVNAREARDIAQAAQAQGVFAMEAMWSRFLPKFSVIEQLLRDGVLGNLDVVEADMGFRAIFESESRFWNPALGGGALLDLGVYPIWLAQFALGAPSAVRAAGDLATTGVDQHAEVSLDYASGARADITVSLLRDTGTNGLILGKQGQVVIDPMFIAPGGFTLSGPQGALEFLDTSGLTWREGLCWQAPAVAQHIADGLTEAPEHTLDRSISQLVTIDAARAALGVPLPGR